MTADTPTPTPTAAATPRIVALVAAKDRDDTVAETVVALRGIPGVAEVVVVDDGSTDATTPAALHAGAWVLHLPENVGKGGAVAAGVATLSETDIYLLVDADVGVTASSAAALLDPILDGRADLVIGVLPGAGGKGGFGLVRRLAGAGIHRACGFAAQAPLSGQRAVRGDLLRRLELAPRFGLETGFTIDAVRAGATVLEVPVAMDHRHTGRRLAGFVHRGRQGADITRALWVRLTSVRTRMGVVAAALVLAHATMAWTGSRWEARSAPLAETTTATKVLVVGIPGLGFDDVATGAMPNLDRLVETGALAAMSVRTGSVHPSVAEGYATLGAGSRVRAAAPAAGDVAAADGAGGPIVVAGVAELRVSAGRHLPTLPGALGEALHAAGRSTAVVGVSDIPGGLTGPMVPQARPARFRPAALALMDGGGEIDAGMVDPFLLLQLDKAGAYGQRADPDLVVAATHRALEDADVVLVDPGDMTRVEALKEVVPPIFADLGRDFALEDTDAILGRLMADLPSTTLLLVVSVVPPAAEWRLTPLVAAGPGVVPGRMLTSPSTKRVGLVTLTDLAPTVLAAVGAPVPTAMIGHALRSSTTATDIGRLARLDRDAAYRERVYFRVAAGFVLAQGLVYALALVVFSRRRRGLTPPPTTTTPTDPTDATSPPPPTATASAPATPMPRPVPVLWRPSPATATVLLRVGVLAFAAFPLATFLFRAVSFAPALGVGGVAVLVVLDAAIVALAGRARRHPLSPLAWIMGITVAVLVIDVATGARLQTASILGYSPHTAARFYGLGNSAFAVLAATGILAAALHLEHAPRRREALVSVAALFALLLVVDGAPILGDDVGGILTLGPVLALTLVALSGRRITWRTVAAAAAVTAVLLGVAAGIDLLRPPAARTHLGQVVSDTLAGHGGLPTTIARKAEANVRVLRASVWAWVVPIVAAFLLGLLVWMLKVDDLLPARSPRRIGVIGAVAAGVLGCLVNDSGIIVTALVLVFVAPVLTLLALADGVPRGRPVLLEPALDTAGSVLPPSPLATDAR